MIEGKDARIEELEEERRGGQSKRVKLVSKITTQNDKFDAELFDRALKVLEGSGIGQEDEDFSAETLIDSIKYKSRREVKTALYNAIYEYGNEYFEDEFQSLETTTNGILDEILDPFFYGIEKVDTSIVSSEEDSETEPKTNNASLKKNKNQKLLVIVSIVHFLIEL